MCIICVASVTYTCTVCTAKMTMEVILATAFGRSVDVQGGAGGRIVKAAYEVFASLMPGADDKPQPFILFLHLMSS